VKHLYTLPVWLVIIFVTFIFTPVLWIFNGGSNGGVSFFIILFSLAITALISGKKRTALLAAYMGIYIALIVFEYYYPHYITNYNFIQLRYQDVAFSTIVSIVSAVFMYSIYLSAYHTERLNAEKYSELLEVERNKLEEKNRTIEVGLGLAKNIQARFLPVKSPVPYLDFYLKPMETLGGDFLDFITFRDSNDLGIFISDVSGHGVPAALITAMIKSSLEKNRIKTRSTKELMEALNANLIHLTAGNFITCFYGIYSPDERKLTFTNAGHNSPYVIQVGKAETASVSNRSLPLAVFDNAKLQRVNKAYKESTLILEKGSKILFYTDGLIEACNINNRTSNVASSTFESEVLVSLLSKIHDLPASDFISKIVEELIIYRGSQDFDDDVCIVCLDVG
jgi:serine phosphatase RsbU (regulator of sigma subunit)